MFQKERIATGIKALGFGALAVVACSLTPDAAADAVDGTIFYTRFSGDNRVNSRTFDYDGTGLPGSFTVGPRVVLATLGFGANQVEGADGIINNPNDDGSVLVGGQNSQNVYRVSKTAGVGRTQAVDTGNDAFHLEAPDNTKVYSMGLPGNIAETVLNGDGSLGASVVLTVGGDDTDVTQVITTPFGFFYTSATGGSGNGSFGSLTFGAGTATTTQLNASIEAAHGGVWDPYSETIMLFGEKNIAQVDTSGTVLADLDVEAALGTTFGDHLDQGTVDGNGHAFAAVNSGELIFLDYSSAGDKRVDNAGNFIAFEVLELDNLDDIAPLVGPGGGRLVPLPAAAWMALPVLGGLGIINRKKKA